MHGCFLRLPDKVALFDIRAQILHISIMLPANSVNWSFCTFEFSIIVHISIILCPIKECSEKCSHHHFAWECKKKTQCVNVIKINTKIAIKNGDACSKSHLACLTVTIVRKLEWITIFSSNFLSRSYSKGVVYMPKNMLRRSGSETSRKSRWMQSKTLFSL